MEGRDHFAKHFPGTLSLAGRSRGKLGICLALHRNTDAATSVIILQFTPLELPGYLLRSAELSLHWSTVGYHSASPWPLQDVLDEINGLLYKGPQP